MKSRVFAAVLFVLSTGLFCPPASTQTQVSFISTLAGTGEASFFGDGGSPRNYLVRRVEAAFATQAHRRYFPSF